VRIPALDIVPLGINADEGDRAATAFDVLDGRAPASWFDSGWFFINMVYFRLLALDMAIFGADIGGGRMMSALVGSAFQVGLAWLATRHFGWRAGLVTLALSTASSLTLQHSRLITEAMPTALLWVVSIAAFLEAVRSGRAWAWVVAGLNGGLGLYFYPSARLWAVGAALTVGVIWLHCWRGRLLELLRGSALAGVAALVAAMPFLIHLRDHPIEITGRYAQTAVLDPNNQTRLSYLSPPEPLPRLLLLQTERTLGMFDRYPDGGGFLPTGEPVFPAPLAALALVSVVYGLVSAWRDARLAILSIWLLVGLSGVWSTVETPNVIRAVGIMPTLYPLMALTLVALTDRLLDAVSLLRPSGARALFTWLVPGALALLVLGTDTLWYFQTFSTMPPSWGSATREGQVVATLGEIGPVYSLEMNEHMVTSGWVRLLAPRAERGRIPNPGRELPVVVPATPGDVRPTVAPAPDQGLSFLLSGDANQRPYQELLYQLYPGGWLDDAEDQRRSYSVSPEALAATRGVQARDARGGSVVVDTFGQLPPSLALPSRVTWSAGVLLPATAEYRFEITGTSAAQLRIDGIPESRRVRAARGLHFVELIADISSSTERVALLVEGRPLEPPQTYRLMDAPWGLLGRLAGGDAFLDATLAMAFFDPELRLYVTPTTITWSGLLLAPVDGTYRMAFAAEDPMQLDLDGRRVDIVTVGPDSWAGVGQGSLVLLSAGAHRVQVTLQVTHGGRELARWNWVPPNPDGSVQTQGQWSVVPPRVLRPDPAVIPAS
jgi:hypothetical protein